jgi:hypothetical protein
MAYPKAGSSRAQEVQADTVDALQTVHALPASTVDALQTVHALPASTVDALQTVHALLESRNPPIGGTGNIEAPEPWNRRSSEREE